MVFGWFRKNPSAPAPPQPPAQRTAAEIQAIRDSISVHIPGAPQLRYIKKPTKRDKTPEAYEKAMARWRGQNHKQVRATSDFFLRRMRDEAGITHYTWSTVRDERVCPECRANEGKMFSIAVGSSIGHPGQHRCSTNGWCRCIPYSVFD